MKTINRILFTALLLSLTCFVVSILISTIAAFLPEPFSYTLPSVSTGLVVLVFIVWTERKLNLPVLLYCLLTYLIFIVVLLIGFALAVNASGGHGPRTPGFIGIGLAIALLNAVTAALLFKIRFAWMIPAILICGTMSMLFRGAHADYKLALAWAGWQAVYLFFLGIALSEKYLREKSA